MRFRSLSFSGGVCLAVASCAADVRSECPDWVNIEVSAGTTPTFSWTPVCPLHGLSVRIVNPDSADMEPMWRWSVYVPGDGCTNHIWPPVTYGTPPCAGWCITGTGPLPLDPGVTYMVRLTTSSYSEWSGCHGPGEVGWQDFTP